MKNSKIYKNIIYISILRQWRLCEVGIPSERVRTYLSSVAGTNLWSSVTAGEHTLGSWQVCLSDQRISPFAWGASRSLPLVQNYGPDVVFSSPTWKDEYPLRLAYFLVMAGYRNLHTSVFSGNLLILSANGNICHSIHRQ